MANPNPTNKFAAGNKFGGRTPKIRELKEFCQEKSVEVLDKLWGMLESSKTPVKVKFDIAKLFLSYGYGSPPANMVDIKKYNDDALDHNWKKTLGDVDNTRELL